jgi:iron complex outermembrane receptor protein
LRFNDDELRNSQTQTAFAPYSPQYASAHTNSGALVGDLNAQYHFNTFNMVYFTYARGYAPQAYNTAAALLTNTMSSPVSRMNINHFEIGSKGRYWDGRMTLNADAFYTIYDNYQIQTFAAAPGVLNPPLVLMNAPQAQTHGVEMSSVIRPAINTTINFSAAYIDATFVNYKNAECWFQSTNTAGSACYSQNGVAYQNVSGKTLPNSPKFKFVANGEQRLPLDSIGYDLVGAATYTYQSSAQMLPDQSPYAVQGAYGLLDLDLGLESQTGRYSATIFVNNVFNKVYYTDMEDFWNTVWGGVPRNESVVGQPGLDAQRYEGIRLSAKF